MKKILFFLFFISSVFAESSFNVTIEEQLLNFIIKIETKKEMSNKIRLTTTETYIKLGENEDLGIIELKIEPVGSCFIEVVGKQYADYPFFINKPLPLGIPEGSYELIINKEYIGILTVLKETAFLES